MPLDGNGGYAPPSPEFPPIPGTLITADDFITIILDLSDALSMALYDDGQATWLADQDAGQNGIVNLTALTGYTTGMSLTFVGNISAIAAGATLVGNWTTSGTWSFAVSPTAPTPTAGDSSAKVATTAFVTAVAFSSALPAISASTAGMSVSNDGVISSWRYVTANQLYLTANCGGF